MQLTRERVREFRHTWKDKKSISCQETGAAKTLPFTKEQLQGILEHCPDEWTRTFVLTMRYTGLRISDAALLISESPLGGDYCSLDGRNPDAPQSRNHQKIRRSNFATDRRFASIVR
jgi:hypothetical protein